MSNDIFQPKSPLAQREKVKGPTPRFYPVTKQSSLPDANTPRKQKTRHSENPPVEMPVGWVLGTRSRTSSLNAYAASFFCRFSLHLVYS